MLCASCTYCRLHAEKAEVQKQKEYFAKLRSEFQPDGGKVNYHVDYFLHYCSHTTFYRMKTMMCLNLKKFQVIIDLECSSDLTSTIYSFI